MSTMQPLGNSPLGKVGSSIYKTLISIRNLKYDLLPPPKASFPIISVGGISAGGTGKTPLTATIIEHVIEKGFTPILFSRGYGRESKATVIVKEDATIPWNMVGDEPAMLKNRYPKLWLAIDGKRRRALKRIEQNLPENPIGIMDDGFQHRKMHRDLDIVTLPVGVENDQIIPAGYLREPLSSLKRADCICVMGDSDLPSSLQHVLNPKALSGSILTERGTCFHPQDNKTSGTINDSCTVFSGIARPERFYNSADEVCENVINYHTFPDHHIYCDSDLEMLKADPAQQLLTTEKDWIRIIGKNSAISDKLWYLTITQRFAKLDFRERFFDLIDICMERSNDRSSC